MSEKRTARWKTVKRTVRITTCVMLVVFGLALRHFIKAQSGYNSAQSNVFSAVGACGSTNPNCSVIKQNGSILFHAVTFSPTGSPGACTFSVDSSPDGITWTVGGVITATSCLTAGSVAPNSTAISANFIRLNVTALSGGATVTLNYTGWSGGLVSQAASNVVSALFSINWVEASAQAGGDIETKISNACTLLSAMGGGGGFITVSFTGTQTGALGSNPFANCPDNAAPGNGTIVFIVSPPSGTILESAPWLTTNKMRIYGGLGGRLARSWTTIKAGAGFKTIANLRKATLAQTTGLVRTANVSNCSPGSVGWCVTATFTNTAGGTGCGGAGCGLEFTALEPVQVGCSTHGDSSFVGTWVLQSANATTAVYFQNVVPISGQAVYTAVGNINGTCTMVGGTPLIGMAENGKDGSTNSGTLSPYGNTQSSPCTAGTNCYGNATAAFGVGVSGLTLDCDDLAGATGCVGLRNILAQEKTFADDLSIINFNFIGMVLDNMGTSGLQNSGAYHDLELYVTPLVDAHSDQCDPVNFNDGAGVVGTSPTGTNNDPIPVEGIFALGLSIRVVHSYTMTMVGCGTKTGSTPNYNPGITGAEFNQTGNMELGVGGTVHCEAWLSCATIGLNGLATGGVSIDGMGGAPVSNKYTCSSLGCAGGTVYTPEAILISANFASTDVTARNTRRNFGMTSSIVNQISGDNLNGAADGVTALYAWDVQGSNQLLLTTSVTVPNRMQSLQLNRFITLSNSPPTCGTLVGFGTGATCAFITGSSDFAGTITVTGTATAPAALGTLALTFSSSGLGTHIPACVWNLSNGGSGTWNPRATVIENGSVAGVSDTPLWDNNAVNVGALTWRFHYICVGN